VAQGVDVDGHFTVQAQEIEAPLHLRNRNWLPLRRPGGCDDDVRRPNRKDLVAGSGRRSQPLTDELRMDVYRLSDRRLRG
jgi:hypothetical protein